MTPFISARRGEGGPPLAVLRDQSVEFPYKFVMSKDNVMMAGTDFSGAVALTVRLNKMRTSSKKRETILSTVQTKVGTENLEIVLSRRNY